MQSKFQYYGGVPGFGFPPGSQCTLILPSLLNQTFVMFNNNNTIYIKSKTVHDYNKICLTYRHSQYDMYLFQTGYLQNKIYIMQVKKKHPLQHLPESVILYPISDFTFKFKSLRTLSKINFKQGLSLLICLSVHFIGPKLIIMHVTNAYKIALLLSWLQ